MKIACVLITHWRMKAELRRNANLRDRPAVIVDTSKRRPLVVDSTPEASGVRAGVSLEDAISRRTDTIVIDADEPYYHKLFDQLIETLLGISDRVEKASPGCAYVQIDGLELLYGSEERLVNALFQAVPADLNSRIGIGGAKFPAFIAALTSRAGQASSTPEDGASFLRPFSIDLLPVTWDTRRLLHRFGLHTLGQVAALSAGELQARFSAEGKKVWELCNGIDSSPLIPLVREETLTEYISLPCWGVTADVFLAALDSLSRRAFARPSMRSRYVGKATLQCSIFHSPAWTKSIVLKDSAGSWERLAFAIRSHINIGELPGLPEDIFLTLSDFTPERGHQQGFLDGKNGHESDRKNAKLKELDRLLGIRTGGQPTLYHAAEADPYHPLPEMRSFLIPLDPSVPASVKPLKAPVPVKVATSEGARPVALYRSVRSKRKIEIAGVADLWKINLWWLPRPIERTYYELKQQDGRLVTVFRDGDGSWYQQDY